MLLSSRVARVSPPRMFITTLEIQRLRNLDQISIQPSAGLNWLYGENGSGKTSVLEAIH
ncbi:MAG: AAA family ATPase, partial [Wenzhouxiangellaceae bacterium]